MQGGLIHQGRTRAEVNSICIVEFESGAIGVAENSWAKHGGMDDRVEVYGDAGVVYADLFLGNSALTYSEKGYGYAMEKAGSTKGWTFTILRKRSTRAILELKHFIKYVREDKQLLSPARIARRAGNHERRVSLARTGQKVRLPFNPSETAD
jgi:predicted dehydrogenase